MRALCRARRPFALILLAVFFIVCYPALAPAGGCDDPGYTGSCGNKPHSFSPPIVPGPPVGVPHAAPAPRRHHDARSAFLATIRSWFVTLVTGLGR